VRNVNTRLSQPTKRGNDNIILSAKSLAMQPPALTTVRHSRCTEVPADAGFCAKSAQGHSKRDILPIASSAGEGSI